MEDRNAFTKAFFLPINKMRDIPRISMLNGPIASDSQQKPAKGNRHALMRNLAESCRRM